MNSYRRDLQKELRSLLVDIERQAAAMAGDAKEEFENLGLRPPPNLANIRDSNGGYILIPLILAKAQVLSALVELERLEK